MNTKLYVDDVRTPPDDTWDVARTSAEALSMLKERWYETVSLDHDLGEKSIEDLRALTDEQAKDPYNMIDTTRPIVLHWCENGGWPTTVVVHSSNPVGVTWLVGMIERYKE